MIHQIYCFVHLFRTHHLQKSRPRRNEHKGCATLRFNQTFRLSQYRKFVFFDSDWRECARNGSPVGSKFTITVSGTFFWPGFSWTAQWTPLLACAQSGLAPKSSGFASKSACMRKRVQTSAFLFVQNFGKFPDLGFEKTSQHGVSSLPNRLNRGSAFVHITCFLLSFTSCLYKHCLYLDSW